MGASNTLSDQMRVLFVDNDPLVQLGARALLAQQLDWTVRSVGSSTAALDISRDFRPHVALVGVHGPTQEDLDNFLVLKPLRIPLIAYGSTTAVNDLYKLLAAGADSYIHRTVSCESLVAAIRDCIDGRRTILTGNENDLLYTMLQSATPPASTQPSLSDREAEVLSFVLSGMSNVEIASHLNISTGTVKAHIGHLLRKHGVTSRTQLAIHATKAIAGS